METGDTPGIADRNLVSSDLFFGLGAVLLIVVAVLSSGIRDVFSQIGARAIVPDAATGDAVETFARETGPVLFAMAEGVLLTGTGPGRMVPLRDVASSAEVEAWLAAGHMLIVAPDGLEASFLTHAAAHAQGVQRVRTLRLPTGCRTLETDGIAVACGR